MDVRAPAAGVPGGGVGVPLVLGLARAGGVHLRVDLQYVIRCARVYRVLCVTRLLAEIGMGPPGSARPPCVWAVRR